MGVRSVARDHATSVSSSAKLNQRQNTNRGSNKNWSRNTSNALRPECICAPAFNYFKSIAIGNILQNLTAGY